MRGMVPPDPQTHVSELEYAVVYAPKQKRTRFPASCVDIKASVEEAIAASDPANKRFAARVHGPSKSSEGQYIFYLMEWL